MEACRWVWEVWEVWEMWEGVREGGCGGGYSAELGPIILVWDTSGRRVQVGVEV